MTTENAVFVSASSLGCASLPFLHFDSSDALEIASNEHKFAGIFAKIASWNKTKNTHTHTNAQISNARTCLSRKYDRKRRKTRREWIKHRLLLQWNRIISNTKHTNLKQLFVRFFFLLFSRCTCSHLIVIIVVLFRVKSI